MSRSTLELKRLLEDLDEEPIDDVEAAAAVRAEGVDIGQWAADIRARFAAKDAALRSQQQAAARNAYVAARLAYEQRPAATEGTLDEQRAHIRQLMTRVPAHAVSAHFHKFDAADADELAAIRRALEHLLDEDE